MGASLACGEVDENSIQMPIPCMALGRRWTMRSNSLRKKNPTKAVTRSWEVSEDDGMIYVWFDRDQKPADPNGQKFN